MSKLKYRIEKECRFEAAHSLRGVPAGHKCGRVHGHSYVAVVTLSAYILDEVGFVLDFGLIGDAIKMRFDHQDLNKVLPDGLNPTAENVARVILELVNHVVLQTGTSPEEVMVERVRVYETPTCWAEVVVE